MPDAGALVGRDAALVPVGAVAAHAQRAVGRPGRPHRLEHLQREAHARRAVAAATSWRTGLNTRRETRYEMSSAATIVAGVQIRS